MSKDADLSIWQFAKKAKWLMGGGIFILFILPLTGMIGVHMENNDAFCASCHTEPESTYFDRAHGGDKTVDLAAFHAVNNEPAKSARCIDCHSGTGINGRLHAMSLGAYDALKYVSGNYPQPSIQTHPIGDENCLKCHADYAANQDFENHFHTFLPGWQANDPNAAHCVSCHQSHTKGDATTRFLDEQITVAVCQECHQLASEAEGSYARALAKNDAVDLASVHTIESVQCTECHAEQVMSFDESGLWQFAQGNAAYTFSQPQVVSDETCLECHEDIPKRRDFNNHFHVFLSQWQAIDTDAAVCTSCHQGHNNNGDASIGFLNEKTTVGVCQNCHVAAGG